MKKGQILEGYIERVDFPNKGFAVVEDEEKKVIVKNTVPEQKVRFAVNKIRKGQAEGRLLEILEHSPEECQPACPHFGVCGGCTYQNLPYEKQVEMKEAQIHAMMDAAVIISGRVLKKARSERHIAIKWNFLLETNIRTDLLHLACIKEAAFTIL
jgi:23S rRNA (uracil1939-C5)-methyltransferase